MRMFDWILVKRKEKFDRPEVYWGHLWMDNSLPNLLKPADFSRDVSWGGTWSESLSWSWSFSGSLNGRRSWRRGWSGSWSSSWSESWGGRWRRRWSGSCCGRKTAFQLLYLPLLLIFSLVILVLTTFVNRYLSLFSILMFGWVLKNAFQYGTLWGYWRVHIALKRENTHGKSKFLFWALVLKTGWDMNKGVWKATWVHSDMCENSERPSCGDLWCLMCHSGSEWVKKLLYAGNLIIHNSRPGHQDAKNESCISKSHVAHWKFIFAEQSPTGHWAPEIG